MDILLVGLYADERGLPEGEYKYFYRKPEIQFN